MRVFSCFERWNLIVLALLFVATTGCSVWNRTRVTSAETLASRQFVQQAVESIEQHNMQNAEEQLILAVKTNPENVEARSMLAETLWKQGKKEAATRQMERVVASPEVMPEQIVRLAEMQFTLQNFTAAQKYVGLALKHDPTLASAWLLHGKIQELHGKNEEALAAYHQAAYNSPEDSKIQIEISKLYLKLGKPQRALETVQIIRLNSTETPTTELILCESKALVELNRSVDARRLLTAMIQKNPENKEFQEALAQLEPIQFPLLVQPETRIGSEVKVLPKPERTGK